MITTVEALPTLSTSSTISPLMTGTQNITFENVNKIWRSFERQNLVISIFFIQIKILFFFSKNLFSISRDRNTCAKFYLQTEVTLLRRLLYLQICPFRWHKRDSNRQNYFLFNQIRPLNLFHKAVLWKKRRQRSCLLIILPASLVTRIQRPLLFTALL